MKKTKTIAEGWTRLDSGRGSCGALWAHTSGWHIQHCGHPTALYPYYMEHAGLPGRILMSHNGMGFTDIKAARQMAEQIAAGELAITTGNCGPATARIPSRTASGTSIAEDRHAMFGRKQGVWTEAGFHE